MGGLARRKRRRRAEIAFGVLSIAVMRRKGAHSGLNWAGSGPERVVLGRARRDTRDSNGAETKVKADFVRATMRDGPFVDIDGPGEPAIGEWRQASPCDPVRSLSRVRRSLKDRSTQPSPSEPPSDSAMPDGIKIITDRMGHLARCCLTVP